LIHRSLLAGISICYDKKRTLDHNVRHIKIQILYRPYPEFYPKLLWISFLGFFISAFVGAIFDLIPNFCPFFPPCKGSFALQTNFFWQIFFGNSFIVFVLHKRAKIMSDINNKDKTSMTAGQIAVIGLCVLGSVVFASVAPSLSDKFNKIGTDIIRNAVFIKDGWKPDDPISP
jgi:hypothetical protein